MVWINTFTLSPYAIAYGGFIGQTLLMLNYVWQPSETTPFKKGLFRFFEGFIFVLGLLFLDSALFWISGQWLYTDWRFQLANVVLGIILGIEYILGTYLIKPNKWDMAMAVILTGITIYMVHFYFPDPYSIRHKINQFIQIGLAIAFTEPILYQVLYFKRKRYRDNSDTGTTEHLWDISGIVTKVYSKKTNIILWIIFCIDAMAVFSGISIIPTFRM